MAEDTESLRAAVVGKSGVTDEDFQSYLGSIHTWCWKFYKGFNFVIFKFCNKRLWIKHFVY